jgi:hypothetical protein
MQCFFEKRSLEDLILISRTQILVKYLLDHSFETDFNLAGITFIGVYDAVTFMLPNPHVLISSRGVLDVLFERKFIVILVIAIE